MPRSEEQNKALRDYRRGKILDRALTLFAIKGFDDVTVDDITLSTNCAHGLFYHYFRSKEDVFNALVKIKEEKYKDYLIPQDAASAAGGIKGLKMLADYCEKIISGPDEVAYFCRISTIRHADKIIVLDRGETVGIGTHEELMKNCDVYREIATSQLSAAELA